MAYNLKNADEVKEYLKNLHIEYKFGCFSEKNPEVCHLLAEFKESVKKEFTEAANLFKKNCDENNYAKSCTKYGDYRMIGKGGSENFVEAYQYLCKGCDLKDSVGCFHAAVLGMMDKDIGEKDRKTRLDLSMKRLTDACHTYNLEKACFQLSGVYLSGIEGYLDKNYKEAYKLSIKCCEQGNPYACANVSQMYTRGEGAEKNPDLAETFKKRAEILYREVKENKSTLSFHQGT